MTVDEFVLLRLTRRGPLLRVDPSDGPLYGLSPAAVCVSGIYSSIVYRYTPKRWNVYKTQKRDRSRTERVPSLKGVSGTMA